MSHPSFPLGVDLMDDDHAHIEEMLRQVPDVPDSGLVNALSGIRAEIADHFLREEALMREHRVPVLECHIAQHARILNEIDGVIGRQDDRDTAALRQFLLRDVASMILSHIASVDQISARFLRGELDATLVSRLRLPEDTSCAV